MKRKITILFLTLLVIPLNAQWIPQNSGVFQILHDVHCLSENFVVVVGDGGTILKTTDGGDNWIQKTAGTSNNLMKVEFANSSNIGYAVGDAGTLLKTIDGAETWSVIDIGETTNLQSLSILDENIFYISGENGLVKKTIDGGISFSDQITPATESITDIQFVTNLIGYAQGDKLLKTIDGGITWAYVTDFYSSSFFFLNENVGFINSGGLYKTIDGGLNFLYLGSSSGYNGDDLFSLDENIIWSAEYSLPMCGCATSCITRGEITGPEQYEDIVNCSYDGEGLPALEAIHFATETLGFVVGWNGSIYKNSTGIMPEMGIDENEKEKVRIYPNPSSEKITISFPEEQIDPFSVEIVDSLGKMIFSKSYQDGNSADINIASFAKGLYFVTIISNDKRHTQKLLKN